MAHNGRLSFRTGIYLQSKHRLTRALHTLAIKGYYFEQYFQFIEIS